MDFSLAKLAKYRQIIGIAVAALVLTVIFVPFQKASAFTLTTTLPDATGNTSTQSLPGEKFTVSINIQPGELISISSIDTLVDNGQPSVAKTTFTVSGTTAQYSSGNPEIIKGNLTLTVPSLSQSGYAYGYGLASNGISGPTGYSYSIPYSNAFIGGNTGGYANAVGNNLLGFVGPGNITVSGFVNTALLSAGSHTLDVVVNTGAGVNPSQLVSPTLTFTVNANSNIGKALVSEGINSAGTISFGFADRVKYQYEEIHSRYASYSGKSYITSDIVSPSDLLTRYPNLFNTISTFSIGTSTAHTAGKVYEIDDSAFSHTGFIYITIDYNPNDLPSGMSENDVKFFHYNGTTWEDATDHVDTDNDEVIGKVTHLSPIVAGYIIPTTSPSSTTTIIGGGGGGGSVIINQVLPQSYFDNNPLAKLQIKGGSGIIFKDIAGTVLTSGKVGQQINIGATYHNYQQVSQNYALIVQVIDKDGFTANLSWLTGTVDAGKDVDGSRSWTIEEAGSYTIKIFVWDSVSNSPIPLSETTTQYFSALAG